MTLRRLMNRTSPKRDSGANEPPRRAWQVAALSVVLLAAFWGAAPGAAKDKTPTARTVQGAVLDEVDNGIPGATVELTDIQTGKVVVIYSQDAGQYKFTDLHFNHDYKIKATYHNSSSEVRTASSLDTRTPLVLNLTIPRPK